MHCHEFSSSLVHLFFFRPHNKWKKQINAKKFKTGHDWVEKVIHLELCKKFKFDHMNGPQYLTRWRYSFLTFFLVLLRYSFLTFLILLRYTFLIFFLFFWGTPFLLFLVFLMHSFSTFLILLRYAFLTFPCSSEVLLSNFSCSSEVRLSYFFFLLRYSFHSFSCSSEVLFSFFFFHLRFLSTFIIIIYFSALLCVTNNYSLGLYSRPRLIEVDN